MDELNKVRANAHSDISEAERIYTDEGHREIFLSIQKIRLERDEAIIEAINNINKKYADKIREIEAQHAFVLTLLKGTL